MISPSDSTRSALPQPWPAVDASAVCFLGYAKASFYHPASQVPQPLAFLRRENESALSFAYTRAALEKRLKIKGLCSIVASKFAKYPPGTLFITQDSEDHLSLFGVPCREEDEQGAMDVAEYLTSKAADVPDWKHLP